MATKARETKNIVICCDGTGNKFGENNSNVVRIYTCLEVNKHQVAYYHPGVGSMGAPHSRTGLGKEVSRIAGMAFGTGFRSNLEDAYRFLMANYADGDRVYLFGFSRGAYTVRALTGALSLYGLLCPGNDGHLPYLMQMFSEASRDAYKRKQTRLTEDALATAFKETFSRQIPIHFVGVWDTVSSIGWIYDPVKLLYDGQNPLIRRGRHAMSVDERRCYFQHTPWGPPLPPEQTPVLSQLGVRQDIVQAYFAGVHSDVGGSYKQHESAPALDGFRWILEEAEADGLLTNRHKRKAVFGVGSEKCASVTRWHKSPEAKVRLHTSLCGFWWVLEFFPHKYFDEHGKHWQVLPLAHRRMIEDGSLLHSSLVDRLDNDKDYKPKNLAFGKVVAYRESPVFLPDPQVMESLSNQHFGVFRRSAPETKGVISPMKVAAVVLSFLGSLFLQK
jgi:uncharacterized protein (DUF2235 family)